MYLKSIQIQNYGPFDSVNLEMNFNESGNPKPLVLIGKNGSGKTILLSHIVNALISSKQVIYDDCEVEKGKVYKYRTTSYINNEKLFSYSKVEYTDNTFISEWQLRKNKEELEKQTDFIQPREDWADIPPNELMPFNSTVSEESAKKIFEKNCVLYFPSNRFEEPGWLNQNNLLEPIDYSDIKNVKGTSNRSIIALTSLKTCKKWLLDLFLDRNTLEQQFYLAQTPENHVVLNYSGPASLILDEVLKIINIIFGESNTLYFGLGTRNSRTLSIMKNKKVFILDLFQLSTGESLLLGLFLSIIRDFDLCQTTLTSIDDISGIVIIDEIDAHLHGILQRETLPLLINLFPKIQFIITTHSPMFLLGMQKMFGENGFDIIELPTGSIISVENFSEFEDLFTTISNTKKLQDLINKEIEKSHLPIVFVEGDYDIRYLTKAIKFYYDPDLLDLFKFADGEGFGNLDKIWTSLNNRISISLTSQILLLYDCDTRKTNAENNKTHKRIIPLSPENPINIGIENLLPESTILKLETVNEKFIDITSKRQERIRGELIEFPSEKRINKDEKKNICDWLCENGTKEDFIGFCKAIEIIIEFLKNPT